MKWSRERDVRDCEGVDWSLTDITSYNYHLHECVCVWQQKGMRELSSTSSSFTARHCILSISAAWFLILMAVGSVWSMLSWDQWQCRDAESSFTWLFVGTSHLAWKERAHVTQTSQKPSSRLNICDCDRNSRSYQKIYAVKKTSSATDGTRAGWRMKWLRGQFINYKPTIHTEMAFVRQNVDI